MTRCIRVVVALAALSLAGCGNDSPQTAGTPEIGPRPVATFQELMLSEIDPSADAIWEAGRVVTGESGTQDYLPKTPEEWLALRGAAVRLVEASNLIVMEGRDMVHPGGRLDGEGAPGTLTAAQAAQKLEAERPLFLTYARALQDAGVEAVDAIDRKDSARMMEVGTKIDVACEACHQAFWYPSATAPLTQ